MDRKASLHDGRYVVRGVLGEGAQGVTFDGVDTSSGRSVAIKRFDVRGARTWKDVELAERETRVLATLDHPLLPRYVEHFEEDDALYLVMERVEGETLEAIRQREGSLSEPEVRRFLACADNALTYLHGRSASMVHRDIKPRNVVRRPDGAYVLVDFGAVSERMKPRGGSTIVGTYGYMAPEQLQGRALPATDVYAVGATALAALTGVEPDELPHRGLGIDVRASIAGRASDAMTAALARMLEPDPDRRAQTLASALAPIHDGVAPNRNVAPPNGVAPAAAPWRPAQPIADDPAEQLRARSVVKLLWVLWGLGWVLVPLLLRQVGGRPQLIPLIMFSWLAATLIVSWHKGAVVKAALRYARRELGEASSRRARSLRLPPPHPNAPPHVQSGARPRVEIQQDGPQVRVHTSDPPPASLLGETEVSVTPLAARRK